MRFEAGLTCSLPIVLVGIFKTLHAPARGVAAAKSPIKRLCGRYSCCCTVLFAAWKPTFEVQAVAEWLVREAPATSLEHLALTADIDGEILAIDAG